MLHIIDTDLPPSVSMNKLSEWQSWGSWSDCSVTCGGQSGIRYRHRNCSSRHFEDCSGYSRQAKQCFAEQQCSNDGKLVYCIFSIALLWQQLNTC